MSEIFKLKVNIGNACVEMEGEANFVHKILRELCEDGLGKLSIQDTPPSNDNDKKLSSKTDNYNTSEDNAYKNSTSKQNNKPNIKDIVIKNLPKTEQEWILIYALYCSDEGKNHLPQMICDKCTARQIA